ncbi:MAG: tetratricopeptide repeat protein [Chloroflexi bacterium]|nr:tetratricopeptide repeat protein [Chloroflexota bacterium]
MKDYWKNGILPRLIALLFLVAILVITLFPRGVTRMLGRVRCSVAFVSPEATADLASIEKCLPWRADLWEPAGFYALAGNDLETAVAYFKQAAALGALSYDGYIALGDAYLQTGNHYTAIQIWEAADYMFGPSEASLTRRAGVHRSTKDYPALIEDLKAILSFQSSVFSIQSSVFSIQLSLPALYHELGMLLAAHDPAFAPPYLLQAAELDSELTDARELAFSIQRAVPKNDPAYTLVAAGQKLADLNEWGLAAHAFRRAAETRSDYAEAWAFLGESLQHLPTGGDTSDSLTALQKAFKIDPQSLPANTFMALYWQRHEDYALALEYLAAAAEIAPRNPAIQADMGAAVATLGDLETAQAHYWQAIELTPRDPTYLCELVEFCIRYNIDLRGTALPAAREAMMLAPDDPASLDVMGQVLFRLDDLVNAERFWLRALDSDPDYAPAHLHLGLLYALQGDVPLARQHLSLAISLAPNTPTAEHAQRVLEEFFTP